MVFNRYVEVLCYLKASSLLPRIGGPGLKTESPILPCLFFTHLVNIRQIRRNPQHPLISISINTNSIFMLYIESVSVLAPNI